VRIANITAENPNAGAVYCGLVDNLQTDNIRVRKSAQQNGQASFGRCVNLAEVRVAHCRNTHGANFESQFAVIEAGCEAIRFTGVYIDNNHSTRSTTAASLFQHLSKSRAVYEDVFVRGKGSLLSGNGGTAGCSVIFRNITFHTSTDPVIPAMADIEGELYVRGNLYREVRRYSKTFDLTTGMSAVNLDLPSGLARWLRIHVTSTTGITSLYISNKTTNGSNIASQLISGSSVTPSPVTGLAPVGTSYIMNDFEGKRLIIYTDGTVPAGAKLTVDMESFAPANGADDLFAGRLQGA
jgi:hypothetical protein